MKKSKYTIGEVKVGDWAFFSVKGVNNLQRYWTVSGFQENGKIDVTVGHNGIDEGLSIHISDIEMLSKAGRAGN